MTTVINEQQSRRERKKAGTRALIITTAIGLFSEHGIDAVTVDQIAAAADVGKGTIYNYFQTKEDIVVAFMVELERTVQAQIRDLKSRRRSVVGVLTNFVQTQLRMKEGYHAFVRVFLGHMFQHTVQFLRYMVELQKVVDPPIEALFKRLQQRDAIRSDINLNELVLVFKTVQLGLVALWAIEGPPFKHATRIVEREITLFCKGLEAVKQ